MQRITDQEAHEISLETAQLEAKKAKSQADRLERKAKREQKSKHAVWEKFVAPIILLLTILISLALRYFTSH